MHSLFFAHSLNNYAIAVTCLSAVEIHSSIYYREIVETKVEVRIIIRINTRASYRGVIKVG